MCFISEYLEAHVEVLVLREACGCVYLWWICVSHRVSIYRAKAHSSPDFWVVAETPFSFFEILEMMRGDRIGSGAQLAVINNDAKTRSRLLNRIEIRII